MPQARQMERGLTRNRGYQRNSGAPSTEVDVALVSAQLAPPRLARGAGRAEGFDRGGGTPGGHRMYWSARWRVPTGLHPRSDTEA